MFENSFILVFRKEGIHEKEYAVKFSYDLEGNAFDGCKAFKCMSEDEVNARKEQGVGPSIADFSCYGYFKVFGKLDDPDEMKMLTLEVYDQTYKKYFFITRCVSEALSHPVTNGSEYRVTFK